MEIFGIGLFGWYCIAGVVLALGMLAYDYGDVLLEHIYRKYFPKKLPTRYMCYRPERDKHWIVWILAAITAIPIVNILLFGWCTYADLQRKWEDRSLKEEKERRHESIRKDVDEYKKLPPREEQGKHGRIAWRGPKNEMERYSQNSSYGGRPWRSIYELSPEKQRQLFEKAIHDRKKAKAEGRVRKDPPSELTDWQKQQILLLDPKAEFWGDGTMWTCLDYGTLKDILEYPC